MVVREHLSLPGLGVEESGGVLSPYRPPTLPSSFLYTGGQGAG